MSRDSARRPPAAPCVPALSFSTGIQICLIRRRPDGDQYSVPGGLVQDIEPIPAVLARELREELDLDLGQVPDSPQLRWVQDQISNRPGTSQPLPRLHLVHLVALPLDFGRHSPPSSRMPTTPPTSRRWTITTRQTSTSTLTSALPCGPFLAPVPPAGPSASNP
ncbi:NUDIX domain-containing protein [Streptomyces sp. NPDC001373]|uniref:NUDIX domain-containing protein n=1 Tax=Streptomyces sp. NPDC001373 TaxID=3364565 RepID=UPI0036B1FE27